MPFGSGLGRLEKIEGDYSQSQMNAWMEYFFSLVITLFQRIFNVGSCKVINGCEFHYQHREFIQGKNLLDVTFVIGILRHSQNSTITKKSFKWGKRVSM